MRRAFELKVFEGEFEGKLSSERFPSIVRISALSPITLANAFTKKFPVRLLSHGDIYKQASPKKLGGESYSRIQSITPALAYGISCFVSVYAISTFAVTKAARRFNRDKPLLYYSFSCG